MVWFVALRLRDYDGRLVSPGSPIPFKHGTVDVGVCKDMCKYIYIYRLRAVADPFCFDFCALHLNVHFLPALQAYKGFTVLCYFIVTFSSLYILAIVNK